MTIVVTPSTPVTALTLIKRALRLLGVYAKGEDPDADESQDALSALNALMDSLSNDSLQVFARSVDAIALSAGTASVTVGPSGGTVTTRPVEVLDESYLRIGSTDYPLDLLTLDEWNAIGTKTLSGLPAALYVQPDMPDITVNIWPQPSEAATLYLWSRKQIRQFTSLTTELNLPPGYERMLAFMLAIDLAPEYDREPSATVVRGAASAGRKIKRTNLEVPVLDMPPGVPLGTRYRDIREG